MAAAFERFLFFRLQGVERRIDDLVHNREQQLDIVPGQKRQREWRQRAQSRVVGFDKPTDGHARQRFCR